MQVDSGLPPFPGFPVRCMEPLLVPYLPYIQDRASRSSMEDWRGEGVHLSSGIALKQGQTVILETLQ